MAVILKDIRQALNLVPDQQMEVKLNRGKVEFIREKTLLIRLAIPCVLSVWCASKLKAPGHSVLYGAALVIGALVMNEILGWKDKAG